MIPDELSRDAETENKRDRDRLISLFIGVLAVLLALASLGGGNAAKNATLKNIEAANTWAFFQAKNMRRQLVRVEADQLKVLMLSDPALPASAKSEIEAKLAELKRVDAELTSNPKTGEGLDELWAKGKALEIERDDAIRRDPYFDYGQMFLQIAIVLASVAIISGGTMVLVFSFVLGLLGTLATFSGFTLLLELPLIG